jgi:hypothetical protein
VLVVPLPGVVTLVTELNGTVSLPTLSRGPLEVSWTPVTTPETELPSASVPVTCCPSMFVAAPACWALTRLDMEVDSVLSCSTSSMSDVWERNCVESTGLSGFWYWSWATSSCKKVLALTPLRPVLLAEDVFVSGV